MSNFIKTRFILFTPIIIYLLILSCEPLVDRFDNIEEGKIYKAKNQQTPPASVNTITVMTYNIRFGAARCEWFGDSCGDKVILKQEFILSNLGALADKINEVKPDILLLQEVDVQSKRSAYIDQVQWLLDHTYLNYGAYASVWKAQVIPSDGLGRMNMGNAVLSRWMITEAIRIQLPLRGDQDALTRYFYLRRNILKTKIALPDVNDFYAVNVHTAAFSTDDTKKKQLDCFKEELDNIAASGGYFVAGGDLNAIPPGSDSTDFCDEDKCPGESFHGPNDDPKHKEGSYFTPEIDWLQHFYDAYNSAVPLEDYVVNQPHYFTETPDWNGFYDRKLDYLFTNHKWVAGSDSTHHDASRLSDHAPISAKWEAPK